MYILNNKNAKGKMMLKDFREFMFQNYKQIGFTEKDSYSLKNVK